MDKLDQFKGCLLGGAAGDALGYAVEFMSFDRIIKRYGPNGITEYAPDHGIAIFSDDTQMTLFTANAILLAVAEGEPAPDFGNWFACGYQDWLVTQLKEYGKAYPNRRCWLNNVPELYSPRAPGNTCITACMNGAWGTPEKPINNSCGCGGVMRVAPVALYCAGNGDSVELADRAGALAAAATHGHPLGYISAAALVHIIYRLIENPDMSIRAAVEDAIAAMERQYADEPELPAQINLLTQAMELADGDTPDVAAIHRLGGGWTGHDALAIAVYCVLKYPENFDAAMIASVNHSGDSDSTGAIAGNILGAKLGLHGIPQKYQKGLEMKELLLEMAEDLYRACREPAEKLAADPVWAAKYIQGTYTL